MSAGSANRRIDGWAHQRVRVGDGLVKHRIDIRQAVAGSKCGDLVRPASERRRSTGITPAI
jgi:hypothetical protein